MSTLQHYIGTLTIDGDNSDFSIDTNPSTGPFAVSLDAADYFVFGYTGEAAVDGGSTDQLLEHIEAKIRDADAAFAAATVSYDQATGLVSVDFATAATCQWDDLGGTDANLRDLLGFTGNLTGASAYTGDNQVRGTWRPSLGMTSYPGDLTSLWGKRSTTRIGVSSDGTAFSSAGTLLYDGIYGYQLLPEAEIITIASTTWESLEQFWEDCLHTGKPVRVYPDRTLNAADSYHAALMSNTDGKVGGFHDAMVGRWRENYNGFWSVEFMLRKHVT